MEFLDVEFDDSLLGSFLESGNWLTGCRLSPSACREYIKNNPYASVGKKGLKFAVKEGINVQSMGGGMNHW